MTQEFQISVTPLGGDNYLVRTERVEPGVPLAEEHVTWPADQWLLRAQQLMDNPLNALLQGNPLANGSELSNGTDRSLGLGVAARSARNLVELGQHIYAALFQGTLRDSWMSAQGIAQNRGDLLQLRLGLKESRLLRLPWEAMHGEELGAQRSPTSPMWAGLRPIAAGADVLFSRYLTGKGRTGLRLPPLLVPGQPLRILMAIASPSDQDRLNLRKEVTHLQQELCTPLGPVANGIAGFPEVQLTVLEQPGRERLAQALEQGRYHIFHFAGHSDLGKDGGSLYLVNERTGLTESMSGDDLAGLLVNNKVHVAVFNSCRGAYTSADPQLNAERNLADALVNRGIPAVLAMAENIPDEVALTLSRLFYRNLRQGYSVDLSLNRARQGLISSYSSDQLYWALPVLYLHADFDGYLITRDRDHTLADQQFESLPLPTWSAPVTATVSADDDDRDQAESDRDLAMITEAVLANDDLDDFGDDLIYDGSADADLIDDEEGIAVANLIQQLSAGTVSPTFHESVSSENDSSEESLHQHPNADAVPNADAAPRIPAADYEIVTPEEDEQMTDAYLDSLLLPVIPDPRPASDRTVTVEANISTGDDETAASASHYGARGAHGAHGALLPIDDLPTANRTDEAIVPSSWRSLVLACLAGVSMIAIVLAVGFIPSLRFWESRPETLSPTPSAIANLDSPEQLEAASTGTLTQVAITQFGQKNLQAGGRAVEALLNRGALREAKVALDAVPHDQLDDAQISFLRGRLAWESIKRGNSDFGMDDARRYWDISAKAAPDSVRYLTALGFALYAEGRLKDSLVTWCKAVALAPAENAGEDLNQSVDGVQCPLSNTPPADPDILNAYAGIALVMAQTAVDENNQPIIEGTSQMEAIAIKNAILKANPVHYETQALSQDWLWTEQMLEEWRSLIAATVL